ncbi:hypothetical protein F4802DRAFT_488979 [Xylaria palmicola]|nr:hypothetical protein F4802DRAFT_488979 [Xylaria palmicola]
MDAGSILTTIELSASILKLGRTISLEFFCPERTPERLRHLETRLQTFNDLLKNILEQAASSDKLATTKFPSLIATEKTLKDCKTFLENYRSLLSESGSLGADAQQLLLIEGPDTSWIDGFHKRIDQLYTELEQWRIGGIADRVDQPQILTTSMRHSTPNTITEDQQSSQGSDLTHVLPEFTSVASIHSGPALPTSLPMNQRLSLPENHSPPLLRAQSRASSLNSIPELPPAAIQNENMEIEPTNDLESDKIHDANAGSTPTVPSLNVESSGDFITLELGASSRFQFSPNAHEGYDDEGRRVIEWSNPQIRIRHFLPMGVNRIPHTKPEDPKMEVTFLPRGSKHRFEITTPTGPQIITDEVRYLFTNNLHQEAFQRQVRARPFSQTVQVLRIHTAMEKNIAINVHLQVWARNGQDTDATFSFAHSGKNEPSHHVEYVTRWFKNQPERKGENRLILYPYSEDTDLSYRPTGGSHGKGSSFNEPKREVSTSSSQSLGSRSPSVGNNSGVLYAGEGKTAPEHVREEGYLDIEFPSMRLRERFVDACFEAQAIGSRTPTRAALLSDADSLSPGRSSVFSSKSLGMSQTTTPQHGVNEVGDGYLEVELPSPAIPRTTPLQFNYISPFRLPHSATSLGNELDVSELSPTEKQDTVTPRDQSSE